MMKNTWKKVPGGIQFEIDEIPDDAIPLVVRIINTMADAIIEPVSADLITTSAVPGTSNVEEALANHETRIANNTTGITNLNTGLTEANQDIAQRAKTVNGIHVDSNGNVEVDEIEFARQIVTDDAQQSTGEFLLRTTGGDASLSDGDAKLVSISGRSVHTGNREAAVSALVFLLSSIRCVLNTSQRPATLLKVADSEVNQTSAMSAQ